MIFPVQAEIVGKNWKVENERGTNIHMNNTGTLAFSVDTQHPKVQTMDGMAKEYYKSFPTLPVYVGWFLGYIWT